MKGQSSWEIARTPRNVFRCSLELKVAEVERPIGCEGLTAYQVLTNSECRRHVCPGVRARVLTSASERRTIRTIGQGPEVGAELR